ncbi:MAG: glycosyltransferase [Anaerolineae bacterium]|nr:glycosyltransferase [Anaerolineae bacterium]
MASTDLAAVRVTAAVPCYNGGRWVADCVASLRVQTRPPDDLLVIDDGSTDDSAAQAERAGAQVIRHGVNQGLAVGRNTALAHATGNILVFVDVDATAEPDLIETLLTGFTGAEVGGVGGQGIEAHLETRADEWRARHARQWFGPRPLANAPYLSGLCSAYRCDALRSVGGFNTGLRTNAEDVDMGLRLRRAGYRLVYLPAARVYHQRADTLPSLVKTMDRWYYWAARVRRAQGDQPWRLFGGVARSLVSHPLQDGLSGRPDLAALDLLMAWVKLRAIVRGCAARDTA